MLQIYMLYMEAMTEPVYIAIKKSGLLELLRLMLQPYLVECRHDFVTSGKMVYITEDEKESVIIQDGSSTLHVDKAHVVLELQKLFFISICAIKIRTFAYGSYEKSVIYWK